MQENKKKCIFIGDRLGVLKEIERIKELKLSHVFVLKDSFLYRNRSLISCRYTIFGHKDQTKVFSRISALNFDILISNGCPIILPLSKLSKHGQIFLNIHPSYLPYFRGIHPVNGVLLRRFPYAGASMHFMSRGIDTGNIIQREKFRVTADIDAGLLYYLVFDLERKVFAAGMHKLIRSRFRYKGLKQKRLKDYYYTRSASDMRLNPKNMSSFEMLLRIRAFGVSNQGARCRINDEDFYLYDAHVVRNKYIIRKFPKAKAGQALLEYDGKILLKTKDGIIKISRFSRVNKKGE